MNLKFEIVQKFDDKEWNANLLKSNCATFFQTYENLTSNNEDILPYFIIVKNNDDQILGQLGLNVIKTSVMYSSNFLKLFDKLIERFSTRISWVYGPIIHSDDLKIRNDVLLQILKAINKIAQQNDVVHIEGQTPPYDFSINNEYLSVFNNEGYSKSDFVSFLIDLSLEKKQLFNNISKKPRGDTNRAKRRNITIKQLEDKKQIIEYVKLNQEWSKTKGLTITNPQEEIEKIWRNHENEIETIFLAYDEDRLISSMRVGCFNKIAYTNFVINSYSDSTNLGGTLLTWHAIEWAKDNNFRIYDLSGGPRLNNNSEKLSSLMFYKSKWGGKETPYYDFIKIRKKISYGIFLFLFRLLRKYHDMRGK